MRIDRTHELDASRPNTTPTSGGVWGHMGGSFSISRSHRALCRPHALPPRSGGQPLVRLARCLRSHCRRAESTRIFGPVKSKITSSQSGPASSMSIKRSSDASIIPGGGADRAGIGSLKCESCLVFRRSFPRRVGADMLMKLRTACAARKPSRINQMCPLGDVNPAESQLLRGCGLAS